MKRSYFVALTILSSAAMAASASAGLLFFDGFETLGELGTTAPGWWDAQKVGGGYATHYPTVVPGNLAYPAGYGAPAQLPGDNHVHLSTPTGETAADRIPFSPYSNNSPGRTLYYSFTMRVTDVSNLLSTDRGGFIAGFNDDPANSGNNLAVSIAGGALMIRRNAGITTNYYLGIAQNPGPTGTDSTIEYSSTPYNVGDTLFIVAAYHLTDFDPISHNSSDYADLWVYDGNHGDVIPVSPGTPTVQSLWAHNLTGVSGGISVVSSFFLRQAYSGAPGSTGGENIDDVRVGTTWQSVTGQPEVTVPEPQPLLLVGVSLLVLLGGGRQRKLLKYCR